MGTCLSLTAHKKGLEGLEGLEGENSERKRGLSTMYWLRNMDVNGATGDRDVVSPSQSLAEFCRGRL